MKGKRIVSLILLVLLILNMFIFFQEEVEAASIDYIVLTDAPNGTELVTVVLPVGGSVVAYASAYNITSGYIGLALVDWYELFPWLGTLDNSTGTSSTFTAGMSGGLTTIFCQNTSVINDTFDVNILDPTIDYIDITDTPDGTPLLGGTVPPNYEEWGNCSAYNTTAGYLYTVNADWYVEHGNSILLGPTPAHGNGINVGTVLTYTFLNASFGGHTDSVQYLVSSFTVDYIQIRSAPSGSGVDLSDPANYPSYPVGEVITFYGAAYNNTQGYIGAVDVGSTWQSSTPSIVAVSTPGSSSTITCSNMNWGTVTITLNDGLGHINTTQVTVIEPTVDFIQIRSAPGGGGVDLGDSGNYPVYPLGHITTFYGAAYNSTAGYIGEVNTSSTWTSSNSSIVSASSPGSSSTITCNDTNWGTVTITLDYGGGPQNTTQVTVLAPGMGVDFILIRDAAGGLGNEVTTGTYQVYETDVFYAAAYNFTVGYIGDVEVDWESDTPSVGQVDTPGIWTNFSAQKVTMDSTCTVTASYQGTINDSTGLLKVLAPRVDYILLTDWAHENGSEILDMDWNVSELLSIFASAYNNTGPTYLGPIEVDWTDTPDRGDFNNLTGTSTVFTGTSAGLTTIKGRNETLNLSDDFQLNLLPHLGIVDYIRITDAPDGAVLTTVTLPVGGEVTCYASGYNFTTGYVGLVVVNWSDLPDLGTFDIPTGTSTTFAAGSSGGSTTITGQNTSLGVSDIFTVDILPPTLDSIILTDIPDGSELTTVILYSGENVTVYASGYNTTSGYIGLIYVNWSESAGLGSIDNLTGTSTTFTAGGLSGMTTITGQNSTLGLSDTFDVSINPPTLDYINITDTPNGVSLTTVILEVYGSVTAYASGYNNSVGYIGLIEVNWSESAGLGSFDNALGTSTTFTAGDIGGWTTITGENSSKGVIDTFDVYILPPEVDYILLTDAANGITLTNVTLNVGENIRVYASAYNNTSGYIGLIWVIWDEPAGLGNLNNASGTSTTFTAGFVGGSTTITGMNLSEGVSDSFDVYINPPEADYILVRTQPGGGGLNLCDPVNYRSYAVGGTDTYYGAMYNYSTNYFDDVPSNATWGSSDNSIVTVTSPGYYTDLTCDDQNWGTITITLSASGKQNTTQVTVIKPTVDYMILTDVPNGTTLSLVTLNVGESIRVYASAYNNTCGYIGLIRVNWDEPLGLGNLDNSSGTSTTFTAGFVGGTTTITGSNSSEGVSDSFDVYINPPEVDYILIRTQPGGGGLNLCDPANYMSYAVGGTDIYYGAMYNYTTNYFDDIPVNATWGSSDNSIVTVTSPGYYTDLTCDDQTWGTITITLSTSGKQNTTQVTVIKPTVDYIHIRDEAGGLGSIITTKTYVVWEVDIFYAAAYNDTADYLGEVEVVWESDDTDSGKVTSPGLWTNFTAQKVVADSVCRISANYSGITDSTSYLTVLAPRIDYITIVDAPNGSGSWVGDITYNEEDKDVFWAAGHNDTADYVKDVEVTWESDNTTVGKVTSGPNEYTNFTAGIKGGYCRVTATFGPLTNQTGAIYVINVNTLPTAEGKYYNGTGFSGGSFSFSTDIAVRVTGRKKNIIKMGLEEDGTIVKEVEVTRQSGNPDIGEISYEMSVQKVYRIVLVYNGHNGGSNPIIVTFEFLERIYSVHLLFNSQDREDQEAILQFNDVIQLVGVVFFDASLSSDFEGYLDDYQWNFGDGSFGSGETLAHAYNENDEYTVTLTVTDDEGGTDSSTISVPVENIDNNNQANAIPSQKGAKGFLNDSGECVVILQCPADMLITNNMGNQIGLSNGIPVDDIEGAFVAMSYSDIEVYYVPINDSFTVEVDGTGRGLYNLTVILVDNDITKKYAILDVPCAESTLDVYIFDFRNEEISISTNEDDKHYSLELSIFVDDQWDYFNLFNMRLNKEAIHSYRINNWETLSSGKPITLLIDEDSDGITDSSIDLETGLSGDEVDALLYKSPAPESVFPIFLFIMICSFCAIGVGTLLTEVGKWALISMILPLYTRLKKEELLDQPTRYKIYGYILGNPGAYFLLMRQVLELGSGQLVYHLKQLEDAELIYSRIDGAKKRFYPANVPKPKDGTHHFSDIEEKMLGIIKDNSGIVQKKIAYKMGVSRQVAGYHLTNMARSGVINKEVDGRKTRYYLVKESSA
jgi:predicted transcriptional regulator